MTGDPRQGAVYRRLAAQARDSADTCYLCLRPIDHGLPRDHPGASSADHDTPVGLGGPIHSTMRGAHRVCNMRRRQKPVTPELIAHLSTLPLEWDTKTPAPGSRTPRHSQDW